VNENVEPILKWAGGKRQLLGVAIISEQDFKNMIEK